MAARQVSGPVGSLLPRRDPRAGAEPLSVHRQRSGGGDAGEAPRPCGRDRPSDAAADPRRNLRSARRPGASGRRVLRGGRRRPASPGPPARGAPGAEPRHRARPRLRHRPGRGGRRGRAGAHAVGIDPLTRPWTRAETYGPLADRGRRVDDYYEAAGVDPRRLDLLRGEILELSRATGLDRDCGIATGEEAGEALAKLDNYLCELKEMQIRDGLHVFGVSPEGQQRTDLLVALLRVPRGGGQEGDASLIRALAADLGLASGFDPLDCTMAAPWTGARPAGLKGVHDAPGDRKSQRLNSSH